MCSSDWQRSVQRLEQLLGELSFRDRQGEELGVDTGFERWCELVDQLRSERRTVFLIGNGASASMASHCAADLAKNGQLHTEVFFDLSLVTAISNDLGYEHVFAEPLRRRGKPGDMLVAISSSGRSPNILAAIRTARELAVDVVSVSAMAADNPLRSAGDLNAYVAATTYGEAETCHAAILHHWMDLLNQPIGLRLDSIGGESE